MENSKRNVLGSAPVNKLLVKFAVPSIISMLVSALYNIVDQLFIGRSVGTLGNAATNIVYPLSTSCVALALLFGIGGASAFNIAMGEGKEKDAAHYIGNAAMMLVLSGLILCIIVQLFTRHLLRFFGAPDDVMPYAVSYTYITSFGFPFLVFATGGGHLIRADGSPKYTMFCNLIGALINTILDPIFIFVLKLGMAGAAIATIIGQIVSGFLVLRYICNYKTVKLKRKYLKIEPRYTKKIISLGGSPFINQIAMMTTQIIMNQSLAYYGSRSLYGESIPLACSGIITKVNMIFFSIIIGISQGLQPIASFNYGARKYDRVKSSYILAIKTAFIISIGAFIVFQIFPRQIISLFGSGSQLYYEFGISYFRIFLFFTFLNFIQPITSNFFTAVEKPVKGIFLSLTRQIIFLLPLIIILPLFIGIDGIMYSGPVSDFMAAVTGIFLVYFELKKFS